MSDWNTIADASDVPTELIVKESTELQRAVAQELAAAAATAEIKTKDYNESNDKYEIEAEAEEEATAETDEDTEGNDRIGSDNGN